MSRIKNFKGKENSNGFSENPENRNNKGRPKKGISLVNDEMKKKGYEPASRTEIEETYLMLFQLTQKHLESYAKNSTKPMLVRIVAKAILSRKGFDVIEKMIDRGVGKPGQSISIKTPENTNLTDEEREKLDEILKLN